MRRRVERKHLAACGCSSLTVTFDSWQNVCDQSESGSLPMCCLSWLKVEMWVFLTELWCHWVAVRPSLLSMMSTSYYLFNSFFKVTFVRQSLNLMLILPSRFSFVMNDEVASNAMSLTDRVVEALFCVLACYVYLVCYILTWTEKTWGFSNQCDVRGH